MKIHSLDKIPLALTTPFRTTRPKSHHAAPHQPALGQKAGRLSDCAPGWGIIVVKSWFHTFSAFIKIRNGAVRKKWAVLKLFCSPKGRFRAVLDVGGIFNIWISGNFVVSLSYKERATCEGRSFFVFGARIHDICHKTSFEGGKTSFEEGKTTLKVGFSSSHVEQISRVAGAFFRL